MTLEHIRKMWRANARRRLIGMFLSERLGVPVAMVSHGKVEWVSQEGVSELGKFWVNHGTDARYIVMKEKHGYCLYDFDSARTNPQLGRVEINDPEVFPTEESAVMAAMLTL